MSCFNCRFAIYGDTLQSNILKSIGAGALQYASLSKLSALPGRGNSSSFSCDCSFCSSSDIASVVRLQHRLEHRLPSTIEAGLLVNVNTVFFFMQETEEALKVPRGKQGRPSGEKKSYRFSPVSWIVDLREGSHRCVTIVCVRHCIQ